MSRAKDVDEYIERAPRELQGRLRKLRETIKAAAPQALEKISYSMPYYGYHGRLAYFGVFTHHIGLYIPGSAIQEHKKELAGYVTATAAIQFPHDQKIPFSLVTKLIKFRAKENEVAAEKK